MPSAAEAIWLAALVVVPPYFNTLTDRVFEGDKTTWLVMLGLMGLAAVVAAVALAPSAADVRGAWPRVVRQPLFLTGTATLVWLGVSTMTSIAPSVSLWGSHRRGLGLLAMLGVAMVASLIGVGLRTRGQRDRLQRVIVLTSAPVAGYAIIQALGADPISWQAQSVGTESRAFSSQGNAIFLGAYLILVIPLVLARLVEAMADRRRDRRSAEVTAYGILLGLQLGAVGLSQSRGPTLGLLTGVFVFVLLLAALRGWRRLLAISVVAGGLVLGGLLLLAQIGGGAAGRLGLALAVGSRTAQQRLLLWDGLAAMATAEPRRLLLGYGPETLGYKSMAYVPDGLIRLTGELVFDRAHNASWEAQLAGGLPGLLAYVALLGAAFYTCHRLLGLWPGGNLRHFAAIVGAACATGGLVGALVRPGLLGIGLVGGLLAAVIGLALVRAWPWRGQREDWRSRVWVLGLTAALAGHAVESQLGLSVSTTQLVVWSYIGMLLAARLRPQLTSAAPAERRPGPRDDVVEALVLGLLLATVTFAPLLQGQLATPEWAQNVPGLLGVAATYLVLGLFPLTWLLADGISPAGSTKRPWRAPTVRAGTVTALLALYGLGRALAGALGATLAFAAFLVAATLALAVSLWLSPDPGARLERPVWRVVAVGVLLAVSMWALALRPLIADVYISEGRRAASGKRWPEARADFAKALSLAPHQERYALFIAGADVELAQASPDGADVHLREALDLLQWASRVRPIDPAYHSRAALVYRSHAQMAPNEKLRQERLQQAVRFSEAALELSPRDPGLMADLGRSFQEMGDYQRAVEWFRRSLAHYELTLDTHMRLGDSLLELGEVAGARQAYCGAVELDADATIANRKEAVSSSGDDPHAHASLALLYSCAGRHQQAVAAALEARQLAPSDAVAGRVGELVERGMD